MRLSKLAAIMFILTATAPYEARRREMMCFGAVLPKLSAAPSAVSYGSTPSYRTRLTKIISHGSTGCLKRASIRGVRESAGRISTLPYDFPMMPIRLKGLQKLVKENWQHEICCVPTHCCCQIVGALLPQTSAAMNMLSVLQSNESVCSNSKRTKVTKSPYEPPVFLPTSTQLRFVSAYGLAI